MSEFISAIVPTITEQLVDFAVILIGALLTWVAAAIRRRFKSEEQRALVTTVERVADLVVRDLEQTLVPAVKAGLADGKLTPDEATRIREQAIDMVVSRIDAKLARELAAHAVEAAVQSMKERASRPPCADA